MLFFIRELLQVFRIFLQRHVLAVHHCGMRPANIAKMPWFMRNSGHRFFSALIAFHKSIVDRLLSEPLANALIREIRSNEVNLILLAPKVNRKACLVLAVVWLRNILFGKRPAVFPQGIRINLKLLRFGPVAADRDNLTGTADGFQHTLQHRGSLFLQNDLCIVARD